MKCNLAVILSGILGFCGSTASAGEWGVLVNRTSQDLLVSPLSEMAADGKSFHNTAFTLALQNEDGTALVETSVESSRIGAQMLMPTLFGLGAGQTLQVRIDHQAEAVQRLSLRLQPVPVHGRNPDFHFDVRFTCTTDGEDSRSALTSETQGGPLGSCNGEPHALWLLPRDEDFEPGQPVVTLELQERPLEPASQGCCAIL